MLVHGDKLRWLAWLRVKMLVRNFRRRPATLVFSIIGILVLLGLGGLLATVLFLALTNLSPTGETELLYLFFSAVLLFWIVLPLLSYSTNEGLDVTKLQLFPLTRLEVMFSLLFSSLFDIWTVFLFVLFGATIVAWWTHSLVLGLMALLVLIVFYVTMVGISQLVLALLMRTLQSRRFRDLSILLIALFSSSCYLVNRLAFGANGVLSASSLNNGNFSPYLQWLPSGVAAGVLRAAMQGNWGVSFGLLGMLLVICALALFLWQWVLERGMSVSESGASRRAKPNGARAEQVAAAPARRARTATRASAGKGAFGGGIFDQLEALVKKELLCFWRDPILRVRIFQSLIYLAIVIFLNFSGGRSGNTGFYQSYLPFVAVVVIIFFMLNISLNTLGIERQSLSTLFLFPLDRRRLLWGKNMAVALMGLAALIILQIISVLLTHHLDMLLPAVITGLAGIGVTLGCANMISVFFPRYQPSVGRRSLVGSGNQAQSGGCLNQLMSLGGVIITAVLLIPVALGIGLPFFLNLPLIWVASMPLSLVYGWVLYLIGTNIAARQMLSREPEILAMTTRE
ncbi:MAG TPA: ABC transporter permease [Ktedonobacteraceae bacterium]|nr:ABC transporter permease [Ktedonobacteraceae bacterium]